MEQLPAIVPLGDAALLVTLAREASWDVGVTVRSVAARIRALGISHVTDVVPGYTTVAVYFDATRGSFDSLSVELMHVLEASGASPEVSSRLIEIPVRYDGPDLDDVAARTGLSRGEVIERHSSRTYRAYISGFAPGFVYLGDLDDSLVLPRRTVPRVRVPAGSVAIAAAQTAVYPLETAGGWHLLGTTASVMFDARRDPPSLVRPGDTVRFIKIS